MTHAPLISFDHVSFSYHNHRVLNEVSFSIEQGQYVCLLGANGSGKSTIARLIDALLMPDSGIITIAGYDTTDKENHTALRSAIGMVFQNPDDQLVATLVEDEVAFGPENLGIHNPELRDRVTRALSAAGLAGYEQHPTHTLSGGQKQRLAIAGALALQPHLLILDEPSSMLDFQGRTMVQKLCTRLHQQGTTILMITHDMDDTLNADRIMVLDQGSLVLDGPPATILRQSDVLSSAGVIAPCALRLSQALNKRGIPVTPALTASELKEALCSWHASA